eukprot:162364-Chlamydomonas_euryale.AAC.1
MPGHRRRRRRGAVARGCVGRGRRAVRDAAAVRAARRRRCRGQGCRGGEARGGADAVRERRAAVARPPGRSARAAGFVRARGEQGRVELWSAPSVPPRQQPRDARAVVL